MTETDVGQFSYESTLVFSSSLASVAYLLCVSTVMVLTVTRRRAVTSLGITTYLPYLSILLLLSTAVTTTSYLLLVSPLIKLMSTQPFHNRWSMLY
ncbi:hypothetical protein F5Y03DRAFT_365101 [Xylaria venustula]|nr:hypothetical protein F5Y03DRAFT_365101 [Xylaria venustula]